MRYTRHMIYTEVQQARLKFFINREISYTKWKITVYMMDACYKVVDLARLLGLTKTVAGNFNAVYSRVFSNINITFCIKYH